MKYSELKTGREFLKKLDHDADLLDSIRDFAEACGIRLGVFTAIGALKEARISFYDQKEKKYGVIEIIEPLEIASLVGNISMKDGKVFAHAHATLSGRDGAVKAGHFEGGRIFACELYLRELTGAEFVRAYDEVTGLSLWG
ncbi:MAG: PPC domain-containing DNA-binding protein [Halobacteriota archaeon]|nr:PPC domain-containing DNA-binding protein [Halobacteriota archaeon]